MSVVRIAVTVVVVDGLALAAVAALLAIASAVLPRRGGGSLEALVDATREEHPQYRDWDTRELTG